jgi:hypothetical protein
VNKSDDGCIEVANGGGFEVMVREPHKAATIPYMARMHAALETRTRDRSPTGWRKAGQVWSGASAKVVSESGTAGRRSLVPAPIRQAQIPVVTLVLRTVYRYSYTVHDKIEE